MKQNVGLRWIPPQAELLKFNGDGAFKPGEQHGGWGVVVRDDTGQLVSAAAGWAVGLRDAFMAELKALEAAINLASSLGAIRASLRRMRNC